MALQAAFIFLADGADAAKHRAVLPDRFHTISVMVLVDVITTNRNSEIEFLRRFLVGLNTNLPRSRNQWAATLSLLEK